MGQIRTVTVTVQVGDDAYQVYPKLEPLPPPADFNVLRAALRSALTKVDPRAYNRERMKRINKDRPTIKEVEDGREAAKIMRDMENDAAYEKGLLPVAPYGYWKRFAKNKGAKSAAAARAAHARAAKRRK